MFPLIHFSKKKKLSKKTLLLRSFPKLLSRTLNNLLNEKYGLCPLTLIHICSSNNRGYHPSRSTCQSLPASACGLVLPPPPWPPLSPSLHLNHDTKVPCTLRVPTFSSLNSACGLILLLSFGQPPPSASLQIKHCI